MLTLHSPQIVQETALRWKRDHKIALVPTMGCLHSGHLALVNRARELGGKVIVSIFVNPLQFAPNEDFERYPRFLAEDEEKLKAAKADLLFSPGVAELYPAGFSTRVSVRGMAETLCGRSRPGHFDGVATVCLKLFQATQPDFAVFGEKDYQQLRVIQRMTEDLNLPLTIVPHATVREPDDLPLSSRNRYLSVEDRKRAVALPRALGAARDYARAHPAANAGAVIAVARGALESASLGLDYVEVASSRDLLPAASARPLSEIPSARLFAAVFAGTTRLIDNLALDGET